jgi:hypothetical protein
LSSGGDHKIVADDLDAGFLIVSGDAEGDLRPAGRARPGATMDEGPQSEDTRPPDRWSRWVDPTAWGRYRHTMTVIRAGDGTRRAVMPVSIPLAGLWELEIHVPFTPIMQPQDRGTWNLEIVSADGRETVSYNAALANVGWNPVGEYQLPAGEVRVEISDRTDGLMVVADAVGWSPGRVRTETTERDSR